MVVLRLRRLAVIIAVIAVLTACIVAICCTCIPAVKASPFTIVVLDAGHGGWDGGVVSPSGEKEADINMSIVRVLKAELEGRGIGVVLTRDGDNALGDDKRSDMKARANIIRNSGASAVISIHVNKYSQSSRRGIQVFYDDTGYGKGFALNMQSTINTYLNTKYCGREFAALGGDYYITKCARVPSIIVECGFISNAEDMKLLRSEGYVRELCGHIADSVVSCASDEVSADIS